MVKKLFYCRKSLCNMPIIICEVKPYYFKFELFSAMNANKFIPVWMQFAPSITSTWDGVLLTAICFWKKCFCFVICNYFNTWQFQVQMYNYTVTVLFIFYFAFWSFTFYARSFRRKFRVLNLLSVIIPPCMQGMKFNIWPSQIELNLNASVKVNAT